MQQQPARRQGHRQRWRQQLHLGRTAASGAAATLLLAAALGFLLQRQAAAFQAPATPVLSSIINPSIDSCTADPAGWVKGPVPAPESVNQILSARHNATFLWGTYQPNQYFGVKSRTAPGTLASGILWHGPGFSIEQARSECRQEDRIRKYGWTQHDGRFYGRQAIDDAIHGVTLTTEYARLDLDEAGGSVANGDKYWATRVHVEPEAAASAQHEEDDEDGEDADAAVRQKYPAAVYLYLAIDCDGAVPAHACLEAAGSRGGMSVQIDRNPGLAAAFIRGSTKDVGDFTLEVGISQQAAGGKQQQRQKISVSYWGGAGVLLADLKAQLEQETRLGVNFGGSEEEREAIRNRGTAAMVGALPDTVSAGSNVVVVRVAYSGPFTVDAVLRRATAEELEAVEEGDEDYEPGTEDVAKIKALVDAATAKGLQRFQERFDRVFALSGGDQAKKKGYKGRAFTPTELEAAQAAFSNMIGGVGFFQGRTSIKAGDEAGTVLESFPTQLFTAVPSRSFFPRGFLWDEGFHQLLLHKWDLSLTYDVLLHWLGQMHAHPDCAEMGWIPREIALGEQAKRRIPSEFLPQDVSVANPPTFLLTLEKVLALDLASGQGQQCDAAEGAREDDRMDFLRSIQARLDMWVRWLLNSQRGPVLGSFRWRGRGDPGEKLMATTFASGLDDYPRASEPGEEEYHVDLLCWVVKGCQILARLAAVVEPGGEASKRYAAVAEELLGSLDTLHWNETLGGYFDYGLHSEDGFFDQTFPVRCGDPKTRTAVDLRIQADVLYAWDPEAPDAAKHTPCPPEFPAVVGLLSQQPQLSYVRGHVMEQHVPRVGYVSLFPFLLGLLPPDSPRLGPILKTLRDPAQLWSPYGIRSLSKKDPIYGMENAPGDAPYWRGYIWINLNFLTLRALHQLAGAADSPYKAQAQQMYTELRDNLLGTILGNYERTGYFWEQYHDGTGEGMRCHPFTGWTALVVTIMAEDY